MIHIVLGLLEIVVGLHNIAIVHLSPLLHYVQCDILENGLLATLGYLDASLFNSMILLSTLPNNPRLIRLLMASVTIFVMVGRQVMGGSWPGLFCHRR